MQVMQCCTAASLVFYAELATAAAVQPDLQQHAARLSVTTASAALPFLAAVTGFAAAE